MFRFNNILLCTSALVLTLPAVAAATSGKTTHGAKSRAVMSHAPAGAPSVARIRHFAPSSDPESIRVYRTKNALGPMATQRQGISVTHIDSTELARHQVTDVKGLMNLAPNLTVQPQGSSSAVNFTLRGVGLNDFTANNTPSVMTYVDGVALPIGYMAGAAMFDMAGVDVSTGPSGYTHGQTVTAGEINIKTADPTKVLHYGASEDIASYNRSITNLYVSGPLSSNVQYRIAGFTQQGGGFQKNINTGQSLGNANKGGLRAKVAWQPDDRTNIVFSGNWMQDNSQAMGAFNVQDLARNTPAYQNNRNTGWGFTPEFLKLTGNSSGMKPSYNNTFWGG
ncbi:MAG: TonB-dependent receptor plug domain-containing protein [Gluconobacter japonicus]|uniref:TonB-dependent receptor plug domain-containing protein n=1 Tax=Gluconobacter japonicus TaxID=376620 RepID=UPI0039EB314B